VGVAAGGGDGDPVAVAEIVPVVWGANDSVGVAVIADAGVSVGEGVPADTGAVATRYR